MSYPNWNPNQQLQGGSPYPQAHNPHPPQPQYQQQPPQQYQQPQYQQQQYPPQQPQGQPTQFPNNGPFGGNPYTQPNPNPNAHLQPQQPRPQPQSPQNYHPTPNVAPNTGSGMQSQAPVRVLPAGGPANLKRPASTVIHTDKTESGGHHSFSEAEVTAFREHINEVLANDTRVKYLIPLKTSDEFFSAASEGLLFCQYVNAIKPGTIPEKLICFKPNPNTFEKTQNHNLAIEGLKSLGFPLVNIGPSDLLNGTKHLILGMTWQAVKAGLFSKLNVKDHPEMIALMNQNEDLNKFLTLTPEDSLFRWFNWHLRNAGVPRNVNNFTTDIKDGEAYLGLMSQLAPHIVSRAMLVERDPRRRAEMVINAATQMGCNKFVTKPEDILEPNPKLNLAFAANLFNKYPGIDVSKYDEMQKRALHEAEQRMREQVAREEEERRRRWEMEERARQQRWAQEDQMRQQEMQRQQEQMRMQQQDMARKQQEEQARLAEQQRQMQMEQDRLRQQQEQIRMQQQQDEQRRRMEDEQRRRMEEEQRMRMMTQPPPMAQPMMTQPPPMMMTQPPPMAQPMMTQPMMTVVPTATAMPPPQMMGVVQTTVYSPPPPQMVVRTVTTQYQINCWCCRRSFDAPPGIVQAVCPFCRSLNKATGPSQTTTVVQQRY